MNGADQPHFLIQIKGLESGHIKIDPRQGEAWARVATVRSRNGTPVNPTLQTRESDPGENGGRIEIGSQAEQRITRAQAKGALTIDYRQTRRALSLAVGSLLIAGCFSLLLIIGRTPVISTWISDPLFFKRCLVLHVDLALVVWFFAFAAGMYSLLPGDRFSHRAYKAGFTTACSGVLAMIAGTLVPRTLPVLANYVPVIDNPVYVLGLALFFGGLLICFINERLFVTPTAVDPHADPSTWEPFHVTPDVATALKTTALAYLVAMTTFMLSWAATPRQLDPKSYYELIFWGGGHVLQVANVSAMLAGWLLLLSSKLRAPVLSPRHAQTLFAILLAPHLSGPLLVLSGTMGGTYRLGFTRLMQFGITPVVLVVLWISLRAVQGAWKRGELKRADLLDGRVVGFAASAALTLTGFVMGSSIRNSNTMIPAHYHASIGAVTVTFMALAYQLLAQLGFREPDTRMRRWIPWQLCAFGFGQVVFAMGFGLGGMHGLSRKAYGVEQHARSWGEQAGLAIMALGGLVAVAGGLLFLMLMLKSWRPMTCPAVTSLKLQPLTRTTTP